LAFLGENNGIIHFFLGVLGSAMLMLVLVLVANARLGLEALAFCLTLVANARLGL